MEQVSPEVLQVGDIIVYVSEDEEISGMLVTYTEFQNVSRRDFHH